MNAAAIVVERAGQATPELLAALGRLLPMLSSSAVPPTFEQLDEICKSQCLLVARDPTAGNAVVGSLTLILFRIPTGLRAWIEDVVVDGAVRGKGIGEALTRAAVSIARDAGAKSIDLTSRQSRTAAHRLYEKIGFAIRDTNVYRYAVK